MHWQTMLNLTQWVVRSQADWRRALRDLAAFAMYEIRSRGGLTGQLDEVSLRELELWQQFVEADLERDLKCVGQWTLQCLSQRPKNLPKDYMDVDIGHCGDIFTASCTQTIPDPSPTSSPDYLDQIRLSRASRVMHHIEELTWPQWINVAPYQCVLMWQAFVALAMRECLKDRDQRPILGGQQHIHLILGWNFDQPGYVGTIVPDGWTFLADYQDQLWRAGDDEEEDAEESGRSMLRSAS
jgi:hypothetical protein